MKDKKNRIWYLLGIGLGIACLFKLLFFSKDPFFDIIFGIIILATAIIIEGNLSIDHWLGRRYSWVTAPRTRIVFQFLASFLYTVLLIYTLMFTIHILKSGKYELINPKMKQVLIPAVFSTIAIIAIDIGYQFFKAWKKSLIEVEKYRTESANAQLQNLKNQLNPHFLFNNLSVLTSLVHKNQDKAVDFINELSKVYRYVLDNKSTELVSLREELDFLEHYVYLLKIRFEDSISFDFAISEKTKGANLPPMCLQMLVENTIQHNEASNARPLKVSIYSENNQIIVENAIQPRTDKTTSSQMGLKNIESRYAYFTEEKVEIFKDHKVFKVILPLISKR